MHLSWLEVKTVRSMYGRGNDRMSIRKQRPKLERILGRGKKFSLTKAISFCTDEDKSGKGFGRNGY